MSCGVLRAQWARSIARAITMALSCATIVCAMPAIADAQEAQAESTLLEEGLRAARASDWERARDLFARAQAENAGPAASFNLAGAEARTGRLREAEATYVRFLAETEGNSALSSARTAATNALRDLRERLPRLTVNVRGLRAGDRIVIDGRTVAPTSSVDVGPHEVAVMRGSSRIAGTNVTMSERERRTIDLTVVTASAEELEEAEAGSIEPVGATPRDRDDGSLLESPWFWTAIGVVVIGSVVAVAIVAGGEEDPFVGNTPGGSWGVR